MNNIQEFLPYILKHENISRIEDKTLLIGDRRSYPFEKKFYKAENVFEAASAIKNMVTQGGGPLEVALNSLVLIAKQNGKCEKAFKEGVTALINSRPTNTTMARELKCVLPTIINSFECDNFVSKVEEIVNNRLDYYDSCYDKMSDIGSHLINDEDGILTTCFPEHSFFLSLYKARLANKRFCVFAPETRPYLQGARLTSSSLSLMGFDHYLITDNMVGTFMREGKINKYMTAADLALKDLTVVNKIGTFQNAVVAATFNIPYYAFAISFDQTKKDINDIVIEYRDSEEVKNFRGVKTTLDSVNAIYPCFDIIPSKYVSGVITPDKLFLNGEKRWKH